jgi:LysM repeat protein
MKQNNLPELPRLTTENFENIFNVYTDEDGRYYYNLLQTIAFPQNLPNGFFEFYDVMPGDTWPKISYKMYNTPNAWWAILLINNIKNPIDSLVTGTRIKVPKMQIIKIILSELLTQS